ncbi:MAG: hypothetical protein RLZZ225_563 [Pseudomonadota bacterium]|jgi:dTDP-glucose 4,6-dehydratase
MKKNSLKNDLNYILSETLLLWEELKEQRIFITGGTGFIGRWILESFLWANEKLNLNAEAVILTRDVKKFSMKCPSFFSHKSLKFHEGNIIDFEFPEGYFSYIIHAATDSSYAQVNSLSMLDTIVQGTKHSLDFARYCGVKKFLFISSGAMYGKQADISFIKEKNFSQLDLSEYTSSYAAGKFIAEFMCNLYAQQYKFSLKIARCFAFFGPYLPLNLHFAIGNFIYNRLNNESIVIKSNGNSYRSYLYIADLCIWLWTILFRGQNLVAYNVGSDERYSILEIANLIANIAEPKLSVKINNNPGSNIAPENYIPDITLAREDLNLFPKINFLAALDSTIAWFHSQTKLSEPFLK